MTLIHRSVLRARRLARGALATIVASVAGIGMTAGITAGQAFGAPSGTIQNLYLHITSPSGFLPQAGQKAQRYVFDFSTSPTGALAAGTGTITLTTAPGTNLGGNNCHTASPGQQQEGLTIVDSTSVPYQEASLPCLQGSTATYAVPFAIAAGDDVEIVDYSVTNAPTPGSHTASVSSSSDSAASTTYNLSIPGVPQIGVGVTQVYGYFWVLWNCGILRNAAACP